MSAADTIIRVIVGSVALVVIAVVTAMGWQVIGPVYDTIWDPALMSSLGWGTPGSNLLFFVSLAGIGLSMVVIIWWLVAPAREDVRQSARRRRF